MGNVCMHGGGFCLKRNMCWKNGGSPEKNSKYKTKVEKSYVPLGPRRKASYR